MDPSAYVAPNATLCGDVRIGRDCRILYGATIAAEGGPVDIGSGCIIMEGAVVRASRRHPVSIADNVLIGPHAYLTGCTIGREVFVATGASVFNGAVIETRSEVRINGVVHVDTRVPAATTVPIGWVAVGDPAEILPPEAHDRIWAVQERLDFPGTVFGIDRAAVGDGLVKELTRRYARALGAHAEDKVVD